MHGVTKKDPTQFTLNTGIPPLKTDKSKQVVPNWLQQIDSISKYVNQIIDRDGFPEIESREREGGMVLADLNSKMMQGMRNIWRVQPIIMKKTD